MNILKIKKNIITSSELNSATQEWEEKNIKDLKYPFTRYFSQVIEIEPDVTIEDLMIHLNHYSETIDFCFYAYTNGVSVKEYFDLMNTPTEKKSFVDKVVFFWSTHLEGDEYTLFGTFHATTTSEEKNSKLMEAGIDYLRLDLTPLNEWKHCVIVLDETIKASVKNEGEDYNNIIKLKNRWTLFEFIQYFLFEITCFGSVEEQKKEIEKFDKDQERYSSFRTDPNFASTLNKEELELFVEEIKEQIKENKKSISIAVEEDDFETADFLKKENTELSAELNKMVQRLKEIK